MYPKIILFLVVSLCLFCVSCSNDFKKAEKDLVKIEGLVEAQPAEGLLLLDSIQTHLTLNKEQLNRSILLRTKARDKLYVDISGDTIVFLVKDYYVKAEDFHQAALASFYSGRVYQCQKKYDKALQEYLDAEKYADNTDDNHLKGLIQFFTAEIYYQETLLRNYAINCFKRAAEYFSKANEYHKEIASYNMIGNSLLIVNKGDSSIYFFDKGVDLALAHNDSTELINLKHNIGRFYMKHEKYEQAKESCLDALRFLTSESNPATIYNSLAKSCYFMGQNDSAIFYSQKVLDIDKKREGKFDAEKIRTTLSAYLLLSAVEERRKKHGSALDYYKDYVVLLREMFDNTQSKDVLNIEKKYNYELIKNVNNRLLIEKQWSVLLILFLSLCILVILFFFYRKSEQNKKDLLEAEEKIYQLNDMARNFDEKGNSFRNLLLHHFNIMKKSALLEGYLREDERKEGEKLLKKFNEIVYGQDSLNWDLLYQSMNSLKDGFFDDLRETFPDLDESEFRICCLSFADLTNVEIAIIMKLSINTIQSRRYTIRKKIGVKGYGNLIDFLNENVVKRSL